MSGPFVGCPSDTFHPFHILNTMKSIQKMTASLSTVFAIGIGCPVFGEGKAGAVSEVINQEQFGDYLQKRVEESKAHAYQRKSSATHPLRLAEICADGLAGDLETLGGAQLEIARGWIREDQWEEAEWVASQMTGPAKPRVHAVLALEYARRGKRDQTIKHLKLAEGSLHQAKGAVSEQIRGVMVEVQSVMGEEQEVGRLLEQLGEVERMEVETRLQSVDTGRLWTLEEAEERLGKMDQKLKTNRLAAQFLVASAGRQLRAGNKEEALRLVHGAGKLATDEGLPGDQRILVSVAKIAWEAGDKPAAKKAMNVFLACVEKWSDEGDWKAPFLSEGLEVLLEWGDNKTAAEWLKTAQAGLPKVFVLDNTKSALAVARIIERVKGAAAADEVVLQGAKAGMVHPHERARASTGVQVCLHYAKLGREVPGAICEVINPGSQGGGTEE